MYEEGSFVRIIDDFWNYRYFTDSKGGPDPDVTDEMKQFAGREYEIGIKYCDTVTPRYRLKNADGWWWDERWLEPEDKNIDIAEDTIMDVFST